MRRGNCYAASEALYHILGGQRSEWKPCWMRTKTDTHWFLKHKRTGEILDASRLQFGSKKPDYSQGRGSGFLTVTPSKKARKLIELLTYQYV